MKCKDCLKEISSKEYNNKSAKGVCRKCRQRMAQIKYQNKKNGTNKEYVPLRLKEESAKTIALIKDEKEERIYGKEIENKVIEDIEKTFEKNKISINSQELPPFSIFMDMFCSLIDIENGYMSEYIKAEDVFNKMERDYQHAYEEAETLDIFDERSKMFRCLLDKRRTVKNGLGQYKTMFRLLQEIVQAMPDVLQKALQARENLTKTTEYQKNHSYKVEASELIADQGFAIMNKEMSSENSKYSATVPLMNYYGNGSPYPFQRFIDAKNEEEARKKVVEFLKTKFPNCPYKSIDLIVTKVVEADEV